MLLIGTGRVVRSVLDNLNMVNWWLEAEEWTMSLAHHLCHISRLTVTASCVAHNVLLINN